MATRRSAPKKTPAKRQRHPRPVRSGNHSTFGEKVAEKVHGGLSSFFTAGRAAATTVGVVVALAVAGGVLYWYNNSYADPENVFWSAMDKNLSVSSVTKEIKQPGSSSKEKELVQIGFTPELHVRNISKVTTNQEGRTGHISIENLGTPKDTYKHYLSINQPTERGKEKSDFSAIYPMWLQEKDNPQLFNNSVFGSVFFGNLEPESRQEVTKHLRNAYKTDFKKAAKNTHDARSNYSYDVKVSMPDYAKAAKAYAENMGLPIANQINPDSYKSSDTLEIRVTIDVLSRQVREVRLMSSGITEKYSGYGVLTQFAAPKRIVDYPTLQKAVSEASK